MRGLYILEKLIHKKKYACITSDTYKLIYNYFERAQTTFEFELVEKILDLYIELEYQP